MTPANILFLLQSMVSLERFVYWLARYKVSRTRTVLFLCKFITHESKVINLRDIAYILERLLSMK